MKDLGATDFSSLSIVIPSRNEQKAVRPVISSIQRITRNQAEIIVVDSSEDNTARIAKHLGAKVIRQEPKGIGVALREGFKHTTGKYIVTVDMDGSYPIEALPEIVKWLKSGYDVVNVVRLKGLKTPNMALLNILGNYLFIALVFLLYGQRVHDVTTGFRGFLSSLVQNTEWTTNYALSSEMMYVAIQRGCKIKEIWYPYYPRIGQSKLNPFKHGFEIFLDILTSKPTRFFPLVYFFLILFTVSILALELF